MGNSNSSKLNIQYVNESKRFEICTGPLDIIIYDGLLPPKYIIYGRTVNKKQFVMFIKSKIVEFLNDKSSLDCEKYEYLKTICDELDININKELEDKLLSKIKTEIKNKLRRSNWFDLDNFSSDLIRLTKLEKEIKTYSYKQEDILWVNFLVSKNFEL